MKKKLILTYLFILVSLITYKSSSLSASSDLTINILDTFMELSKSDDFYFNGSKTSITEYADSMHTLDDPSIGKIYGSNVTFFNNDTTEYIYANDTMMETSHITMVAQEDDPIVQIVPRNIFKTPNIEKLYIGKEYGVFVKTSYMIEGNENGPICTNLYLLDFTQKFDDFDHYKQKITPLFQREYVYFDSSNEFILTRGRLYPGYPYCFSRYINTQTDKDDVVVALPYVECEREKFYAESNQFFLSDVEQTITLFNEQHLNQMDEDYVPKEDKGKYIMQQDVAYKAKIYDVNDNELADTTKIVLKTILNETTSYILDYITYANEAMTIINMLSEIVDAQGDTVQAVENLFTYIPNYVTAEEQIEKNGYLCKNAVSKLVFDLSSGDYGEGSYLYYDIEDFIEFDYQLGYTSVENGFEYIDKWDTTISRGLSLEFRSEFDKNYNFKEAGFYNYELREKEGDQQESRELKNEQLISLLPFGSNRFSFTPSKTGLYTFDTIGAHSKPSISIQNNDLENEVIISNDGDDISGLVELRKDITYCITIEYEETNEAGKFNLTYNFTPSKISLGNNNVDLIYDETYLLFEPDENAYYRFSNNMNVVSEVYDNNFNYKSKDVNGFIMLEKNNVYYLKLVRESVIGSIDILVEDKVNVTFYERNNSQSILEQSSFSTIEQVELLIPTEMGYVFKGWKTVDGDTVTNDNIKNYIQPNLNLYPDWEVIEYDIFYYGIDGSVISNVKYTIETGINFEETPAISKYIILNWLDENGNIISTNDEYYTGTKHYFPDWVKETSEISFDCRSEITDGILTNIYWDDDTINVDYGEIKQLPVPFSIDGFEFKGWTYNDTQVTNEYGLILPGIKFEDNATVEAKWLRTQYYFELDMIFDNGIYDFDIKMRDSVNGDNNVFIDAAAVENGMFDLTCIEEAFENMLEEASYDEYSNKGYNFEYYTSVLNDSTKRVYMINIEDTTQGFTLYPYFKPKDYIIDLCYNGKILTLNTNYEIEYNNYNDGKSSFDSSSDFIKKGYKYVGFYDGKGNKIFDENQKITSVGLMKLEDLVDKNRIEVVIKFEAISYNIIYNSNGGDGFMFESTHTFDEYKALRYNEFTRGSEDFLGWNTNSDGTGDTYADGQLIKNLCFEEGDTIELYAMWPTYYTVKYIKNGGTGNDYTSQFDYGEQYRLEYNHYNKVGHSFLGWSTTPNGPVVYENAAYVTYQNNEIYGEIYLYAIWEANTYTITYHNLLDKIYKPSGYYIYGVGMQLPDSLTYEEGDGYDDYTPTFPHKITWYDNPNFYNTPIKVIGSTDIGNIDLYAKYEYTKTIYKNYYLSYTVTDDKSVVVKINIFKSFVEEIQNANFEYFKLDISFKMKEIDDGYQEVYIDGLGENKIIYKDSSGTGKNTALIKVEINGIEVCGSQYAEGETIELEFKASGSKDDDWYFEDLVVEMNYSF